MKGAFDNIGSGISSLGTSIGGFFTNLWDNHLKGAFDSIGTWFSSIGASFSSLLDYINPFSDKFFLKTLFGWVQNIFNFLNPFDTEHFWGYKFIDMLKSALNFLFVPSDDSINSLVNIVKEKFAFVDSIKIAINSFKDIINNINNTPSLSITLGSTKYTSNTDVKVIDMSWYVPFKHYGDIIITGFSYAFFLWRLYVHAPSIISGVNTFNDITSGDDKGGKDK